MIIRKTILIYSICTICLGLADAQTNIDSIDNVLKTTKDDTAKVNLLLSSNQTLRYTLPEKSLDYCLQTIALSKKINYPLGLANAYRLLGSYYFDIKNETDSATRYYLLADSIYHQKNDIKFKEGTGAIQHALGTIQLRQGNYLEAVHYLVKAARVLDSLNNKTILPKTYNNLSLLYTFLKQFDKAEFYARACVRIAEVTGNLQLISGGSVTLAAALIEQKKYEEALPNILKAKDIAQKRNDHYILGVCYRNLGHYYGFYKKDYVQAINYNEKALEQVKLLGNQLDEAIILINMSGFYFFDNQFEKAKNTALKANELSHSLKSVDMELRSLYYLAQAEAHFGDTRKAYDDMHQSWDLKDSAYTEENRRQIDFLDASYQSEKKEKEILKLQNEKQINEIIIKRRNIVIYALFVTICLLFVMALLIYRNIRNKRIITENHLEIEKHKVRELENEKILSATQSVLQGEETERKRLARDLHDGLGGLLSGVKVALNNMKGNVILTGENVESFNQALGMLDNSITELRRVAHNMMPEALVKLGLKDTLTDFCSELGKLNPVQIDFQFYGQFERVESNLEINIFRIIQELVNNVIKHAEAKELVVQMIQEPKRLCFIVLDTGIGFDLKDIQFTKGIGLASIKSRVDSFNGQMEINSKPGKGTEITIEFSI
jgi:two-component system, NarL family, sensor kinase